MQAAANGAKDIATEEFSRGEALQEQAHKLYGKIRNSSKEISLSEYQECKQWFVDAEKAFKKSAEIAAGKHKSRMDKMNAESQQRTLVEPYKQKCSDKKERAEVARKVAIREKGRELAAAEFSEGEFHYEQANSLWREVGGAFAVSEISKYEKCERLFANAESAFKKCVELAHRQCDTSDATKSEAGLVKVGAVNGEPKDGACEIFTLPGGVKMEMVYVAPTKKDFWMGRDGGNYREGPSHPIRLSKGYWIGKYPVTQSQWAELVAKNKSARFAKSPATPYFCRSGLNSDKVGGLNTDDFPMEGVSHEDCEELVALLNKKETSGRQWMLPTEAQWEFAARGGNKSLGFAYCGGDDINVVGWYNKNSNERPHSVKEKDIGNELGIVGMSGNVAEWCRDAADDRFYEKCKSDGVVVDPFREPDQRTCTYVVRGGMYWSSSDGKCLSTYRDDHDDHGSEDVGCRLCCMFCEAKEDDGKVALQKQRNALSALMDNPWCYDEVAANLSNVQKDILGPIFADMTKMNVQISLLLKKYTEKHPEIVAKRGNLEKRIGDFKIAVKAIQSGGKPVLKQKKK